MTFRNSCFRSSLILCNKFVKSQKPQQQQHACFIHDRAKEGTNKLLNRRFRALPIAKDAIYITYVWIDGTGERTRAKVKVINKEPERAQDLPTWHYDGSSTYQATGENSDMTLVPVSLCRDPFLEDPHKIVLCEAYDYQHKAAGTNHRKSCLDVLIKAHKFVPWFGYEQEYTLLASDGKRILGWPLSGFPAAQGPYYCASGGSRVFGRDVADSHMFACQYARLPIAGTNSEVMPGQWEYQMGPGGGIDLMDSVWLSRYILERIAEEFGADLTIDPKPMEGDWNGTGMHCNFSTKQMREDGGLREIKAACEKLSKRHMQHIAVYDPHGGDDNKRRLTGRHETAPIDKFSWAVGSRGVSVRIPRLVAEAEKGWLEDRRPAGNADPYKVAEMLVRTICLNE